MILYEAPHHLIKTLELLKDRLGNRRVTICRELTKKFEEAKSYTLEEALSFYEENEPRGEYVLVLEGRSREELKEADRAKWADMSLEDHMKLYEDQGIDRKAAMKAVATDRGISKRDVYQALLNEKEG